MIYIDLVTTYGYPFSEPRPSADRGSVVISADRGLAVVERESAERILVEKVDGPLCRLRTLWTFQPRNGESCDVGFDLSYEFASPLLALLLTSVFDAVFSRFVQAFERRADIVYGGHLRRSSLVSAKAHELRARTADAHRFHLPL